MIFFDRAVIPQSPHSGTTGIKKKKEGKKAHFEGERCTYVSGKMVVKE